jgi:hypothetical protein
MGTRRPPRTTALSIVGGEIRGAVDSVGVLLSAWRQGAVSLAAPVARAVHRVRTRPPRGTRTALLQGASEDGTADPAGDPPALPTHASKGSPTRDDPRLAALEDRYRKAIRALVRQIVESRKNGARNVPLEEERIRQLLRALDGARATRTELQTRLEDLETRLASRASTRHAAASDARDRERWTALQAELVEARRQLAHAEDVAQRCHTLEEQFCWEVLEDVDLDKDDVDLSRDSLTSEQESDHGSR